MKDYRSMEVLGEEVSEAAKEVCTEYEEGFEDEEEAVNVKLRERLNRELPSKIADRLDEKEKGDIKFFARVLSRTKEEPKVGADLASATSTPGGRSWSGSRSCR